MPRYVILTHDHPFRHWDFMLEADGVLHTWRLLEEPVTGHAVRAEKLPDHRVAYLDYEGPVSGGRGSVARWDHGTYDVSDPAQPAIIRLRGARDLAFAELASGNEGVSWTFRGIEQRTANLADATSSDSAGPTRG